MKRFVKLLHRDTRRTTRLVFALAVLSTITFEASAQDKPVVTSLMTLCDEGTIPTLHYQNNRQPATLEVSSGGAGSAITYRGPSIIRFFSDQADLSKKDAAPVLLATLPAEDRVLLVFSNRSQEGTNLSLRAIGTSTKNHKPGEYRVFNSSGLTVRLVVGGKEVILRAGEDRLLASPEWNKVMDLEVSLFVVPQETETKPENTAQTADPAESPAGSKSSSPRPVLATVWGHRPERRNFMFIVDRSDPKRPLDVRRIFDMPSVPAIPVNQ